MTQNKRTTLEVVLKAIVVGIIVYIGIFAFYLKEVETSSFAMPTKVNESNTQLTSQLSDINSTVTDIKNGVFALSETKGIIEKAITSIEGFTALIKLMGQILTFGFNSLMIGLGNTIPIPETLSLFFFLIVTVIVIFAMLKAISGRENI